MGERGGAAHVGVGRVRAADADVVGDRPMEHRRILRHVGNCAAERSLRHAIDRLPADEDVATLDVRKAQEQPRQGRLAAARSADEAHFRARRDGEREAVEQQRLRRAVAKTHVPQLDAEVPGRKRPRVGGVNDRRRLEQQFGELRRVGQGALEAAVDAVELPHHTRHGGVVAEGDEYRLQAAGRTTVDGQGDDEAQRVRRHVHR